jgi:hypothetical protein
LPPDSRKKENDFLGQSKKQNKRTIYEGAEVEETRREEEKAILRIKPITNEA